MASAKKKPRIQASEVEVGSRTLEGVLIDLAEQIKANDARQAERLAQYEERLAQHEARSEQYAERSARAEERSARAEERSAEAVERSARAEELATLALQSIASVSKDLRALAQQTGDRLQAVEKAVAAE